MESKLKLPSFSDFTSDLNSNGLGWMTEETFQQPTIPADDVKILAKGLQELTQPIEWDDGEA